MSTDELKRDEWMAEGSGKGQCKVNNVFNTIMLLIYKYYYINNR